MINENALTEAAERAAEAFEEWQREFIETAWDNPEEETPDGAMRWGPQELDDPVFPSHP